MITSWREPDKYREDIVGGVFDEFVDFVTKLEIMDTLPKDVYVHFEFKLKDGE